CVQGIPTLVNRHDRDYVILLKDVKEKVKQEALQSLTSCGLVAELQSYSEVCEALTTVEVALGFLAMTGEDPHMSLAYYLEEVLQMQDQTAPHILKALSVCRLEHCVALWQLLTSLKFQNMMKLKRDPFAGFPGAYKEPLGEDERRSLSAFLARASTAASDRFLLELIELKVSLVSYVERKDLDVPAEVEELLPEQICLSHSIEAWKFGVAFRQDHRNTQRS
ncbi:hypothetical protein CRUP_025727, partial [Coryphaenoides rupestris]